MSTDDENVIASAPTGFVAVPEGAEAGLVYPSGEGIAEATAPAVAVDEVWANQADEGMIARFHEEHPSYEPETGSNPQAELRAAEQARIESGEATHYGH